jgi:hypothetical protein
VGAPPAGVAVAVPFAFPQVVLVDDTVNVGFGLMVTTTVAVFVQPPAVVPVTVYVVVIDGVAVTEVPEVELKPVEGDQV